ncbi:MAG: hypothetical protein HYV60_12450, partial [Planctomycetia bacterium]|nr:hypothetical protein [Planctomycetia bacterium]
MESFYGIATRTPAAKHSAVGPHVTFPESASASSRAATPAPLLSARGVKKSYRKGKHVVPVL